MKLVAVVARIKLPQLDAVIITTKFKIERCSNTKISKKVTQIQGASDSWAFSHVGKTLCFHGTNTYVDITLRDGGAYVSVRERWAFQFTRFGRHHMCLNPYSSKLKSFLLDFLRTRFQCAAPSSGFQTDMVVGKNGIDDVGRVCSG